MDHRAQRTTARTGRAAAASTRYLVAGMVAVLFAVPLVSVVASSLKTRAEASAVPPTYWPTTISWENFTGLQIGGTGVWHYVANSAAVSLGTVALTLLVAVPAAYGFARLPFAGSRLLFGVMLGAIMVPFQILLTPLYVVVRTLGVADSLLGLVLVYTTFQLPFSMLLLSASFRGVPDEVFEAFQLDGAGDARTLLSTVPLIRPAVATTALFAFFAAWNEFIAALILLGSQSRFTLPILLTTLTSGQMGSIDWGVLQAGVVLTIVPCAVVFLALQRHYASGLMAGAGK